MPSLAHTYLLAKARIYEAGYGDEVRWQEEACCLRVDETEFLRQAAWVILSAGMRETVIRAKFRDISTAFCDWQCANSIHMQRKHCAAAALRVFSHRPKINAIATVASRVSDEGFSHVHERLVAGDIDYLMTYPYLGPATAYHLAKNLGADVVKPDRHLLRAAAAAGCATPDQLCREIAEATGDRLSVIDLVVWRFATITPNYVSHFGRCREGFARAA